MINVLAFQNQGPLVRSSCLLEETLSPYKLSGKLNSHTFFKLGDTTIDAESDKLTQNTEADHVDRLCQNIVNGIKKISQNGK